MRVAGRGVPWQTVAGRATVAGFPGLFRGASGPAYPEPLASASSWYDALDILTADQDTLASRVGSGVATFGSTSGSDFNDPVRLPHDGTNYVYLPGTASNNLSVPKDGGWAGTMHVTATLVDDTTATFTTTASPILIGNTLLAAGRYKRFDVRDTDGAGVLRVTINLATETLGQTSWMATTGQTVTVNRSTSGLTTAVLSYAVASHDTTDDFIQLPVDDIPSYVTPTTGAVTVLVARRAFYGAGASRAIWSSGNGTLKGLSLYQSASGPALTVRAAGTASPFVVVNGPNSKPDVEFCALRVDNGLLDLWVGDAAPTTPASITGLADIAHATTGPRINSLGATVVTQPGIGEFIAYVQWPYAVSNEALDDAKNYLMSIRS